MGIDYYLKEDEMNDEKEAREIIKQFGYRSDAELSLADIQWLTKEIQAHGQSCYERGFTEGANDKVYILDQELTEVKEE